MELIGCSAVRSRLFLALTTDIASSLINPPVSDFLKFLLAIASGIVGGNG